MPNHINKERNHATRESLYRALLKLLGEKEYARISISDLCGRAGVSRNAYYRNYDSMDDVLVLPITKRLLERHRIYKEEAEDLAGKDHIPERIVYRMLLEERELILLLQERDILYILQKALYRAFGFPEEDYDKRTRFCAIVRIFSLYGLVAALIDDGFSMGEDEFASYMGELSMFR